MSDKKSDKPDLLWQGFLGLWVLDPDSCQYEQGDPPRAGSYRIEETPDGRLTFHMEWVDAAGEEHKASFTGTPNGEPEPFAGGELADAMSVTPVSARELNSAAYYKGQERMIASRQLDDTGGAMRLIQAVLLPDGAKPTNVSIYVRAQ